MQCEYAIKYSEQQIFLQKTLEINTKFFKAFHIKDNNNIPEKCGSLMFIHHSYDVLFVCLGGWVDSPTVYHTKLLLAFLGVRRLLKSSLSLLTIPIFCCWLLNISLTDIMWDTWLRRFLGRILKALNARLPLQYKKFQRKPASLIGVTIFEYTSVQIIGVSKNKSRERSRRCDRWSGLPLQHHYASRE